MTKETGKQETIEEMQGIVAQRQFNTLDAFVEGQNNFYAHFLRGNTWAESRRESPHFKRFQAMYPKLEEELSDTVNLDNVKVDLAVQERLYSAYKQMSQLVFKCDDGVKKYSHPDQYLTS